MQNMDIYFEITIKNFYLYDIIINKIILCNKKWEIWKSLATGFISRDGAHYLLYGCML